MGEKGENTLKVNHPTGAASEEHIDTIDKITKASSLTSFSPIKTTEIAIHEGRTVMLCLDHSDCSEYAFNWALKNFIRDDNNDLLCLVTVREPVLIPGAYSYADTGTFVKDAEEESRIRAHDLVKKYAKLVMKYFSLATPSAETQPKGKCLTIKGIITRGDPREELIRKANELNATTLVMGSRGLGALKRTLLGSVSNYIVNHADVPVLVIKSKSS